MSPSGKRLVIHLGIDAVMIVCIFYSVTQTLIIVFSATLPLCRNMERSFFASGTKDIESEDIYESKRKWSSYWRNYREGKKD